MSVALPHPPFDGETPHAWSARVLRDYYPAPSAAAPVKRARPARQERPLQLVRSTAARCTYCGARTPRRGDPTVCHAHADLILLDPMYAEPAALPHEESAAGSNPNGG